jgi:hypothetical protein
MAQIPGDVIVEIKQKAHPTFKRDGNDLKTDFTVSATPSAAPPSPTHSLPACLPAWAVQRAGAVH